MPQTIPHRPRGRSIDAPSSPDHPVIGVRRRLQALIAAGSSYSPLAHALHVSKRTLSRALEGHPCPHALELAVLAGFDQLIRSARALDTSEATGMRGYARWRGWAPAEAWPGRSIDDPQARPLRPSVRELVEDVEWMATGGETWMGACRRLQMTREGLYGALQRAGRTDLWQRLVARSAAA